MRRFVGLLLLALAGGLAAAAHAQAPTRALTGNRIACTNGLASAFPCSGVDLMAFLPVQAIGGESGVRLNDIWGWTDPQTGKEYALVGRTDGTAFVDVSDPLNPVFVGGLPRTEGAPPTIWRDVKVYKDHAFIVSDGAGAHGMQVFDLTRLRSVPNPPATFSETAHYDGFGSAHNLAINEESGFAYAVGIRGAQNVPPGSACGPGYHIVDIRNPVNPTFAGCFSHLSTARNGTGYTHDAQCVLYRGPDAEHRGREICFGANETAVSIADVTDKASPVALSAATYPDAAYAHQGWLTEDHRYFFLGDELDELQFRESIQRTRTLVWDVSDLDDPQLLTAYSGPSRSIDHNQYVAGDYLFQANYTGGLRILDLADIGDPREVAYFDTVPADDDLRFDGAWSVYPFFESGTVVVSSMSQGLFVLEPTTLRVVTATEDEAAPERFALSPAYPNPFNPRTVLTVTLGQAQRVRVAAYDVLGREVAVLYDGVLPAGRHALAFEAAGLPGGTYLVRAVGAGGTQTRLVTLVR